jgi:hypothetical protein
VNEWFDAELVGKTDGREINLLPAFTNITLLVVASAAFGRRTTWTSASSDSELVSYHSMNFTKAIKTTISYLFLKAFTPTRVYTLSQKIHIPWLTSALNNTTNAFESLRKHMLEIVSDARAAGTPGAKPNIAYPASQGKSGPKGIKYGLLANLVEANMVYGEDNVAGEKTRTLTDEELLSDTFVRSKNLSAEGI